MKRRILPVVILTMALLAGCKGAENTTAPHSTPEPQKEESTPTSSPAEEIVDNSSKEVSIPQTPEDGLRFWAENYEDITSGKYTGDVDSCACFSVVDYDGDAMPELIVGFNDGRGNGIISRYFDTDDSLSEVKYCKYTDQDGNESDLSVPADPMMMYESAGGQRHFISLLYENEADYTYFQNYEDLIFDEKEEAFQVPTVSHIKRYVTHMKENSEGELEDESVEYLNGDGDLISKEEFYNEYGLYTYSKEINADKVYRVVQNINYISDAGFNNADEIYEAMASSFEGYRLMERSLEDPESVIEGTWKLMRSEVDGDSSDWDPSNGEIKLVFENGKMNLIDNSYDRDNEFRDLDYYIDYSAYYEDEEIWYVQVGEFGEYKWVSLRLNDLGELNLMGAINYSEVDYGSIYWTFVKE